MIVKLDGQFEIIKRVSGEYLARLKSDNGHVLFITKNYSSLDEIEVVIKVIRKTIIKDVHNKNRKILTFEEQD